MWTKAFHRYVEPVEEAEIRNLIRGWNQCARNESDLTVKFVFLWFCFNACLAFESEEDLDAEMIKLANQRVIDRLQVAIFVRGSYLE